LLITHRLSQIRSADHILLMKNGRLIAQGTHDDLLATSAVYRQIFAPDEVRQGDRETKRQGDQISV
jgi:ATP-binding cassette subfamily B protein